MTLLKFLQNDWIFDAKRYTVWRDDDLQFRKELDFIILFLLSPLYINYKTGEV